VSAVLGFMFSIHLSVCLYVSNAISTISVVCIDDFHQTVDIAELWGPMSGLCSTRVGEACMSRKRKLGLGSYSCLCERSLIAW